MSIPKLTFEFLNYLNKVDTTNLTLLELGSGDSSIYWSKLFKKIVSYENDLLFLKKFKELKKEQLSAINNLEFIEYSGDLLFVKPEFRKHVETADFILIDNSNTTLQRLHFCLYITLYKKEQSQIILDNGTWNNSAYDFMFKNFFCIDFPGKNENNEDTVTSLFFKRKLIT